jgi:TctA family transporter
MLALGVPGSPTAAVLLGGLLIWGLQPGPMPFIDNKDFVWGLIASMYLGNVAGLIIVRDLRAAIRRDPAHPLQHHRAGYPGVLRHRRLHVHNSTFDVMLMLVFGVIGYFLKKCHYPLRRWCWRSCSATRRRKGLPPVAAGSQGSLLGLLLQRLGGRS